LGGVGGVAKGKQESEFALDKYAELLDDKISKNIIGDLKRNMHPGGFPSHKPLLAPTVSSQALGPKKAVQPNHVRFPLPDP
jgi:hypothetical protein